MSDDVRDNCSGLPCEGKCDNCPIEELLREVDDDAEQYLFIDNKPDSLVYRFYLKLKGAFHEKLCIQFGNHQD